MSSILKLTVENPEELLNPGAYDAGALIQIQTGSSEAGPFADLTGTGSTPTIALVAGTRSYTGYDPAGTGSSWYQTRFRNAAATRVSEWSAAFQAGAEEGFLASLYDVKLRVRSDAGAADTADDALLLQLMAELTADISSHCGRRFVRSPLSGTASFLFDVRKSSRRLRIPQGIAQITALEVATSSQPATGGSYTTVPTSDWYPRPEPAQRIFGWPATALVITDNPAGPVPAFYAGHNVVRATMAIGWPTPPADVQGIFINAVLRRFLGRGTGVIQSVGSESFGAGRLLRWISPEEREKLDWYAQVSV